MHPSIAGELAIVGELACGNLDPRVEAGLGTVVGLPALDARLEKAAAELGLG